MSSNFEALFATVEAKEVKDAMRLIQESTVANSRGFMAPEAAQVLGQFLKAEFKGRNDPAGALLAAVALGVVIGYQRGMPKLIVPPS